MTPTATDDVDLLPPAGKTGALIIPKFDQGHAKLAWDKNDPKDVEIAREEFKKAKASGYAAYRVDPKDPKGNTKGEILTEFDPNAEQIIMLPQLKGG